MQGVTRGHTYHFRSSRVSTEQRSSATAGSISIRYLSDHSRGARPQSAPFALHRHREGRQLAPKAETTNSRGAHPTGRHAKTPDRSGAHLRAHPLYAPSRARPEPVRLKCRPPSATCFATSRFNNHPFITRLSLTVVNNRPLCPLGRGGGLSRPTGARAGCSSS